MRSLAALLAILAAPPALATTAAQDPCLASTARVSEVGAAALGKARSTFDPYRTAWRRACALDAGPVDVGGLLTDAESLIADVIAGPGVSALVSALGPDDPWPVPAIRRGESGLEVDWAAIVLVAPRASAEDARALRSLGAVEGPGGGPAWIDPGGEGARACVRLAETDWVAVAQGIEALRSAQAEVFSRRAPPMRERLLATLGELSKGKPVCACVKGDVLGSLAQLGSKKEKLGTREHRSIASASDGAVQAIRTGAARISFLREAPGAPATGCAGIP